MKSSLLIRHLSKLHTDITALDSLIGSLSESEIRFRQHPSVVAAEELETSENSVAERYREALDNVQSIHRLIEVMLSNKDRPQTTPELPTVPEVQALMTRFFKGTHIRYQSGTVAVNCGCYAHKVKQPKSGDFVCAHCHDSWVLMIVLKFQGGECFAYDPTDVDAGIKVVKLEMDDWTPLPTIIPQQPAAKWEYSKGTKVLSLWRTDVHEWTTEFYKATVVERPCDRALDDPASRGYLLDFGDDNQDVVPEQFVVTFPER